MPFAACRSTANGAIVLIKTSNDWHFLVLHTQYHQENKDIDLLPILSWKPSEILKTIPPVTKMSSFSSDSLPPIENGAICFAFQFFANQIQN